MGLYGLWLFKALQEYIPKDRCCVHCYSGFQVLNVRWNWIWSFAVLAFILSWSVHPGSCPANPASVQAQLNITTCQHSIWYQLDMDLCHLALFHGPEVCTIRHSNRNEWLLVFVAESLMIADLCIIRVSLACIALTRGRFGALANYHSATSVTTPDCFFLRNWRRKVLPPWWMFRANPTINAHISWDLATDHLLRGYTTFHQNWQLLWVLPCTRDLTIFLHHFSATPNTFLLRPRKLENKNNITSKALALTTAQSRINTRDLGNRQTYAHKFLRCLFCKFM